jgi:hypothetical protein
MLQWTEATLDTSAGNLINRGSITVRTNDRTIFALYGQGGGALTNDGTLAEVGYATMNGTPLTLNNQPQSTLGIVLNNNNGIPVVANGGTVTLTGTTLSLSLGQGFTANVGDVFPILFSAIGITGTFNNLTDGAVLGVQGMFFRINYTPTAVNLTRVVPTTTHLGVAAPANVTVGTSFSITVSALTASNNSDSTYRDTVHFTSTDARATLPADYTFTPADQGVHTFTVTLPTVGAQSITATDVTAGFTGSASIVVILPVPAAPSSLTATALSATRINLSWVDNSSYEAGFKIERKSGVAGPYAQVATVGANVTSFTDTGLSPLADYYYRVRAYNASGDSGYSNEATIGNHAPVAIGESYRLTGNTSLAVPAATGVLANDSDRDGDRLHARLVVNGGPAHAKPGTFSLNDDGSFTYTPADNFEGNDGFQYQAYDGAAYSDPVTVNLTVDPAPTNRQQVTAWDGTVYTLDFNGHLFRGAVALDPGISYRSITAGGTPSGGRPKVYALGFDNVLRGYWTDSATVLWNNVKSFAMDTRDYALYLNDGNLWKCPLAGPPPNGGSWTLFESNIQSFAFGNPQIARLYTLGQDNTLRFYNYDPRPNLWPNPVKSFAISRTDGFYVLEVNTLWSYRGGVWSHMDDVRSFAMNPIDGSFYALTRDNTLWHNVSGTVSVERANVQSFALNDSDGSLFMLGTDGQLYHHAPGNAAFVVQSNVHSLLVNSSDGFAYALGLNGDLLRYTGTWTRVEANVAAVAPGINSGAVLYTLGRDNTTRGYWGGVASVLTLPNGPATNVRSMAVDSGRGTFYALTGSNQLYSYCNGWTLMESNVQSFTLGLADTAMLYTLGLDHTLRGYYSWGGGYGYEVWFNAAAFAVNYADDSLYVRDSANQLYRYHHGAWGLMQSNVQSLAVNPVDGAIWTLDTAGTLRGYVSNFAVGSGAAWTVSGVQTFVLSTSGKVCVLKANGDLLLSDPVVWSPTLVDQPVQGIALTDSGNTLVETLRNGQVIRRSV